MKVIKRNGAEVDFDVDKIKSAVTSANNEINLEGGRMTENSIEDVASSVERKCKKLHRAVGVEEIQEMVETALMEHKAYETAKRYIRYRYMRNVSRGSTIDDAILSLVEYKNEEVKQENSNKDPEIIPTQRDYIAGEVSKDITRRMLLPKDIVEAHEAGIIHFHDADYFIQHSHNCDLVNLEDMLQNGTVISGTLIEKPHMFSTACNIATQIVSQVASSQQGGQSISLAHLVPFVDDSRRRFRIQYERLKDNLGEETFDTFIEDLVKEDVKRGIQTIQYQVITLMTTNGWLLGRCKIL